MLPEVDRQVITLPNRSETARTGLIVSASNIARIDLLTVLVSRTIGVNVLGLVAIGVVGTRNKT